MNDQEEYLKCWECGEDSHFTRFYRPIDDEIICQNCSWTKLQQRLRIEEELAETKEQYNQIINQLAGMQWDNPQYESLERERRELYKVIQKARNFN